MDKIEELVPGPRQQDGSVDCCSQIETSTGMCSIVVEKDDFLPYDY